jgi:ATP-dependent Clp protease ATP-binding subunit ClpC
MAMPSIVAGLPPGLVTGTGRRKHALQGELSWLTRVTLSADSGTLITVFEHFTDGARRTLVLAHGEAQSLDARSIGPEHLLLGMVRERIGVAGEALVDAGADYDRARALIETHEREQTEPGSEPGPFSKSTMTVLERSLQISWARADGGIDTEHLLIAILEQNDDSTEAVLSGLDVTPEEILQRVDVLLSERTL